MRSCTLQRWLVNWHSDGSSDWPRWTHKHLQECAGCRNWWQEQRSLEARLAAGIADLETAPRFTEEVLRRIEQNDVRRGFRSGYAWKLATAGACVLAAVIMFGLLRPEHKLSTAEGETRDRLAEVKVLVHRNAKMIEEIPARVDDPLQKELAFMISDTKKAVAFVADSIVPDEFRKRP
jgi:predicted anti-sigma-YlaC factor YlaD